MPRADLSIVLYMYKNAILVENKLQFTPFMDSSTTTLWAGLFLIEGLSVFYYETPFIVTTLFDATVQNMIRRRVLWRLISFTLFACVPFMER